MDDGDRLFFDLSSWRKVEVTGADASGWLNDLVSKDLDGLDGPRRSLLLSPTGRIRAEFTVARVDDGFLLLQDRDQPKGIDALLAPYILSSDVTLTDRTSELALIALPGAVAAPEGLGATVLRPSSLGPGLDLVVPSAHHDRVVEQLGAGFRPGSEEELEAHRVREGLPKLGVDATEEDLPPEAGLDGAVSYDKGCYLGQEAVAKVRNLGHPRRLLLALDAAGPVARGEAVTAAGEPAGRITSVGRIGDGFAVLARIRWDARDAKLRTAGGVDLAPRKAGR